ncbi:MULTISPECIES: hypothetical protein [unclassified Halomonas]|uniref:hypothetical protein n=1 Tax=unclassified Halomonas TaxID=2609666 RepID=UPI00209E0BF3|nr:MULTISPECIES: hypothetical protein [unclassified Halomonas]MCP1313332.1 hypothetical protein [Halomonas sp. 707D7]MCP1326908.1 hypothetical protein [Halomonas sp. 707D4]
MAFHGHTSLSFVSVMRFEPPVVSIPWVMMSKTLQDSLLTRLLTPPARAKDVTLAKKTPLGEVCVMPPASAWAALAPERISIVSFTIEAIFTGERLAARRL